MGKNDKSEEFDARISAAAISTRTASDSDR